MQKTLIVAKMDRKDAPTVADIFAESDAGALPKLVGVRERTLFRFHDLYFHLIESEQELAPNIANVRTHPLFTEVNTRLAQYITAYDPDKWRGPDDAMAQQFYHWPAAAPVMPPHVTCVSSHDVPANRRRGGDVRTLLSPTTAKSTAGFMGTVTLEVGESIAEHYHPYSEEYLYLVRGNLTLRVDGQPLELQPDEAVFLPKNTRHRLENHGDQPVFIVFHLSPLAPRPDLGHVDTEGTTN